MNKPYINLIISLTCLIIFFTMWVGFYFGKESQKDIYRDKANQVLAETKELKRQIDLQVYTRDRLMKDIKKRVDSITVVKTIYIKR